MRLEKINVREIKHKEGYKTEVIEVGNYQEIWLYNIYFEIKILCYVLEKKEDKELMKIIEKNLKRYKYILDTIIMKHI